MAATPARDASGPSPAGVRSAHTSRGLSQGPSSGMQRAQGRGPLRAGSPRATPLQGPLSAARERRQAPAAAAMPHASLKLGIWQLGVCMHMPGSAAQCCVDTLDAPARRAAHSRAERRARAASRQLSVHCEASPTTACHRQAAGSMHTRSVYGWRRQEPGGGGQRRDNGNTARRPRRCPPFAVRGGTRRWAGRLCNSRYSSVYALYPIVHRSAYTRWPGHRRVPSPAMHALPPRALQAPPQGVASLRTALQGSHTHRKVACPLPVPAAFRSIYRRTTGPPPAARHGSPPASPAARMCCRRLCPPERPRAAAAERSGRRCARNVSVQRARSAACHERVPPARLPAAPRAMPHAAAPRTLDGAPAPALGGAARRAQRRGTRDLLAAPRTHRCAPLHPPAAALPRSGCFDGWGAEQRTVLFVADPGTMSGSPGAPLPALRAAALFTSSP